MEELDQDTLSTCLQQEVQPQDPPQCSGLPTLPCPCSPQTTSQ